MSFDADDAMELFEISTLVASSRKEGESQNPYWNLYAWLKSQMTIFINKKFV